MSPLVFLLWLVSIPLILSCASTPPPSPPPSPRGFLLNCGAEKETKSGDLLYTPDEDFIAAGNRTRLNKPDLWPILSTLRYFPEESGRKYCYVIPVGKGGKYLVRTTYYYGEFDGGKEPPVFDQIIDGTKWSVVNTTEDFAKGLSSYYEVIVVAQTKTLSVCVARNEKTRSSPFISALEVETLEDSVYNSTDFGKYALSSVARTSFGYDGDVLSFPDDAFNRHWQPFKDDNPVVTSHSNVTSSDFWNLPPSKVFLNASTTSRGKTLKIQWPPISLPNSSYYISFYFQDNRTPSPYSWRVFDVTINGKIFFSRLNVTTNGVTVYASQWPLSGLSEIALIPGQDMPVGPVINAAEILQIFPIGGRTLTRDVVVMEDLARSFNKPPADWRGDPCLPARYSWTGVSCSMQGKFARVGRVNLTSFGLTGTLPPNLGDLSALSHLWLGGNKLSGTLPDMAKLRALETLHLENNQFEGEIPQSLSQLPNLREIFLQNNNMKGEIPDSLKKKSGVNIQV